MIVFITAVLVLAAVQSFCKIALLPRKWEFVTAALLMPLPLLLEKRIAALSLKALNAELSGVAALENWCAVVVIQELFTLVVGFSLIADFSGGAADGVPPPRRRRWKLAALLPSLLLPAGVFYLQVRLFNALPQMEFRVITRMMSAAVPLAVILPAEAIRLMRRSMESRIMAALHAEYLLLAPAIFLPVAARARLMPEAAVPGSDPWPVLGALAAFVVSSALGFELYKPIRKYIRKKRQCLM